MAAKIENFITGIMVQYQVASQLRKENPLFHHNILNTAGRVIMEPKFWMKDENTSSDRKYMKHRAGWYSLVFGNRGCPCPLFSASMFFCWKYLAPQQVKPWLRSVFTISSGSWRAQLLLWLLGAPDFVSKYTEQPSKFNNAGPDLSWRWSKNVSLLYKEHPRGHQHRDFIDEDNAREYHLAVKEFMTEALYQEWLNSFKQDEDLQVVLYPYFERFEKTYLR